MANRVCLGARPNGSIGLYISRPGIDVLTASADTHFLFNSEWKAYQVVQTGEVSLAFSTWTNVTFNIVDVGHRPFIQYDVIGWEPIAIRWLSNSQLRLEAPNGAYGTFPDVPVAQRRCVYQVFSVNL